MKAPKKVFLVGLVLGGLFYSQAVYSGNIDCDGHAVPTKPMTFSGPNFDSYCLPCIAALRTYGRVPVIDAITAAFAEMQLLHPDTFFVYGEIGFPDGGQFRPHRTHREGTSVDIMVPLKQQKRIETSVANRFGYDVEFDEEGKNQAGQIDFAALGSLILSIKKQARLLGGDVERVIFAPDLQPELEAAKPGILTKIRFNKNPTWVRHDDHIHVDFKFACDL